MRLNLQKGRSGARAAFVALVSLFGVVGLPVRGKAAANPASVASNSYVLKSNFAIADFDGDRKPDLATVEVRKEGSSTGTQYSIRFELTAGSAQVFGLTAPAGGLQIVARDVNGDDALDLLVSTAWLHQRIAVLLNDGHGKFTLTDPGTYPASIWGCEKQWKLVAGAMCDNAVLVGSGYSSGDLEEQVLLEGLSLQAGCVKGPRFHYSACPLLFSLLGRAPPTFVHLA